MASSSIPSLSRSRYAFDVFLSFRGKDTRDNFVSHLYTVLAHKGFTPSKTMKSSRGEN
ncbi:hypothetical protein CsSME_00051644 [Camellia sinensis var. sinensis]